LTWGVSLAEVNFDRKPYIVQYQKDGETHRIRRTPPPKLHDMSIEDKVTISRERSAFWSEGDTAKVVGVSQRQPNMLQIEKDGQKTFVPYFDVQFKSRDGQSIADAEAKEIAKDPLGSKYLLWP
jgi:hypothetical protein